MSDAFVAEIRIFPFNFAPRGWAFCDGQILLISQNTALFSLLGVNYGGDGRTNFALPNLQGAVPIHASPGNPGPGLSDYSVGESLGSESDTLTTAELPAHSHAPLNAENPAVGPADQSSPSPTSVLAQSTGGFAYRPDASASPVPMNQAALSSQGGGQPHNNLQPSLTLNFCIALQGIYPPRA